MPEPTTAPVPADDLRARLEAAISNASCGHVARDGDACSDCRTNAVVAELAALCDPGDLPQRMAEAIDFATCKHIARGDESACGDCRAAAAMSVRWEDHAQQAAELAQALARADHAEKAALLNRERADQFRRERDAENVRADRAEAQVAALRDGIRNLVDKAEPRSVYAPKKVIDVADLMALIDAAGGAR